MNRPVIIIDADLDNMRSLFLYLDFSKYNVFFGIDISISQNTRLALISIGSKEITPPSCTWLAWDKTGDPFIIAKAYQAGAKVVFPKETPANIIAEAINRQAEEFHFQSPAPAAHKYQSYHRGELVQLYPNEVLYIKEGILATTMIHQDGKDVLLGMSGKEEIIIGHPDDTCRIQIVAYTNSKIEIEPWERAIRQPGFPDKMKQRLQQMEGWAAMQARPSLSERVLGILGLLAGQFGYAHELGILIDVRITHAQLASALGSTRTSITRTLSELRDSGKIKILSLNGEDRYCLRDENLVERHVCN